MSIPVPIPPETPRTAARALRGLSTYSISGDSIIVSAASMLETMSDELDSLRAQVRSNALVKIQEASTDGIPAPHQCTTQSALSRWINERTRQITVEGYDPANDLAYTNSELILAAICYLQSASGALKTNELPTLWPWGTQHWKPSTPERDITKAVALLLAEEQRRTNAAAGL